MSRTIFALLLTVFLSCIPAQLPGTELEYDFSYRFQGYAAGRILLIIPYRAFYYSSVAMTFKARRGEDRLIRFSFKDIGAGGIMMRTGGFTGRTLLVLAAHKDPGEASAYARQRINDFDGEFPRVAKLLKRKRPYIYRILPTNPGSYSFIRSPEGRHHRVLNRVQVQVAPSRKDPGIYFNVYKIAGEILKAYNHSILPPGIKHGKELEVGLEWQGPKLDYTQMLNRVGSLAAYVMKKYVHFNQAKSFRLTYRVTRSDPDHIHILGQAHPHVKVWRNYKIESMKRSVIIRTTDDVTVADALLIVLKNARGHGIEAEAVLRLVR